ncbi:hypothetical protein FA15DRAFT_661287 [Coprinopsis marcescibilis]|uniref:Uncharacterized protein n=1 Tax=Coprinopsis marcescibilis TaxID=230819 RepID=A0A5C3KDD2_COPMA|nr:hypothetical protein FA15DRAFT_661287 [Coprinopsis marcescibilis]
MYTLWTLWRHHGHYVETPWIHYEETPWIHYEETPWIHYEECTRSIAKDDTEAHCHPQRDRLASQEPNPTPPVTQLRAANKIIRFPWKGLRRQTFWGSPEESPLALPGTWESLNESPAPALDFSINIEPGAGSVAARSLSNYAQYTVYYAMP